MVVSALRLGAKALVAEFCCPERFLPNLLSPVAVSDPATRQIIWRHFDANTIADQHSYPMFAHLTGNCCQYHMLAVIKPNLKERVWLLVNNSPFRGNQIIFCQ